MLNNRFKVAAILLAAAALFGLVTLVFWGAFREMVVIPFYYLIWVGGLMIESIPQGVYLALLVLVCIGLGLASSLSLRQTRKTRLPASVGGLAESRYRFWLKRHQRLDQSSFMGDDFAFETRKLVLGILAYQEGLDRSEVESRICNGELPAPEPVIAIFKERKLVPERRERNFLRQRIDRLRSLFGWQDQKKIHEAQERADVIISFIEERMEIHEPIPTLPTQE